MGLPTRVGSKDDEDESTDEADAASMGLPTRVGSKDLHSPRTALVKST